MKTRLLLPLLLITLAAHAADPKPGTGKKPAAAAKARRLRGLQDGRRTLEAYRGAAQGADGPANQREEFLSIVKNWFGAQKAAADAFLKKYPEDPHRYGAQMISIQAAMQLSRIPGAEPDAKANPDEQRKQIDAIIAAADAPEDVKGEATFARAMFLTELIDPQKPRARPRFSKPPTHSSPSMAATSWRRRCARCSSSWSASSKRRKPKPC